MLKFIGLALGIAGMALAQAPQFEVASVKPDNGPFIGGVSGRFSGGPGSSDPGRFRATQVSLRTLIMLAWELDPVQLRGPKSLDDWFTIAAVVPPGTTKEQYQKMLQNLIVERFHLASHRETIEVPGYDLVVAPGGSKLTPYVPDNNAVPGRPGRGGVDADGFPRLGPGPGLAAFTFNRSGVGVERSVRRQTMAGFAKGLGRSINSSNGVPPEEKTPRVADKTGLTGIYEIRLGFMARVPGPGAVDNPPNAEDPGGPDIFTALQNDLGLKLVKSKNVATEVLVVDQIDKVPTEN